LEQKELYLAQGRWGFEYIIFVVFLCVSASLREGILVAAEGRAAFVSGFMTQMSGVICGYLIPRTSAMEYWAGGFWMSHSAARKAPRTKVSRLWAVWLRVMVSPRAP